MGNSPLWSQPKPKVSQNPTGGLREGKKVMERISRQRWRRRRRKQLDGGRDMPRVSSPSYPSDWQGRPLPSKQNHQFLLRKEEEEEKKSLPLNDVGCVSYLTVGWINSTMWKAFRVSSHIWQFAFRVSLLRLASSPRTYSTSLDQTMQRGTQRDLNGFGRRRSRDVRTVLKSLRSAGLSCH